LTKEDGSRGKTRVSVRIAGRFLAVLTDEDPESVRLIEKRLNDAVDQLGKANPRMATRDGKTDAVILCAVEAESRADAAERRAEEAGKKLRQAEKRIASLVEDYARLEARLASRAGKPASGVGSGIPEPLMERLREALGKIR